MRCGVAMLKLRENTQVYISFTAVDMRKSIDGLSAVVSQVFDCKPQSGHLFIFFNSSRDKVKILHWDRNGFMLYYKRMERHRFVLPKVISQSQMVISETQLNGLLAGLDFELMGDFVEIEYDKLF